MRLRSLITTVVLSTSLLIGGSVPALADDSPPPTNVPLDFAISTSPAVVRPGGSITVTGQGFEPRALIHLAVSVAGSGDVVSHTRPHADAKGRFTVQLTAPQTVGNYTITAGAVAYEAGVPPAVSSFAVRTKPGSPGLPGTGW